MIHQQYFAVIDAISSELSSRFSHWIADEKAWTYWNNPGWCQLYRMRCRTK